tara:strand:- start:3174 stop:4502 length:1329 start_codon:yes stop_codon:yes gene_type:complete
MKISVVGAGYVGLVTAACFAEKGHKVICSDNDIKKIKKIKNLVLPFYEPSLEKFIRKNIDKNLSFTTDLQKSVFETEVTIITVGTPFKKNGIDLKYIEEISREIGKVLRNKTLHHYLIVKSTVTPNTCNDIVAKLIEEYSFKRNMHDFNVCMNPEFLREGNAIQDFMEPDRIVLGAESKKAHNFLKSLYSCFDSKNFIMTNNNTAEMIKYGANSFFATLISFANEFANLCSKESNIDYLDVLNGITSDKRITGLSSPKPDWISYLKPGCGYGGSCFPKDIKSIVKYGKEKGSNMNILRSVDSTNKNQFKNIINIIYEYFDQLSNLKISILGLSFKEMTSDMREAPSIPIIKSLHNQKAKISAYDPKALQEAKKHFKKQEVFFSKSLEDCIKSSDVIIITTPWKEFLKLPFYLDKLEISPLVIDGRRILNKNSIKNYRAIGLS